MCGYKSEYVNIVQQGTLTCEWTKILLITASVAKYPCSHLEDWRVHSLSMNPFSPQIHTRISHPFCLFCNSSLCVSFYLVLYSLPPLFCSFPTAYPREPDWSTGCLFGVQLMGSMGTLRRWDGRHFRQRGSRKWVIQILFADIWRENVPRCQTCIAASAITTLNT